MNTVDTIVAPASAVGGAVTIIRISGSQALPILRRVWQGKGDPGDPANNRKLLLGKVSGDPTLAVLMRGPHSYTGEDVAELQCHGGAAAADSVLNAVLSTNLARLAEPGEYTFRAFINGKMDLSQAEAVADLVGAGSNAALKLAERQLSGALSNKLNDFYNRISDLISECEARLDFPDEELDFDPADLQKIAALQQELSHLQHAGDDGSLLRDGVDIVLAGRPNAGKSSLFNLLLGRERSIVTNLPGTTRDTVEAETVLRNLPVRLTDTAGLRESSDVVEQCGVERSFRAIAAAKLTFWVLDSAAPDLETELAPLEKRPGIIAVWNKCDLAPERNLPDLGIPAVKISVIRQRGIEDLLDAMTLALCGTKEPRIPEVAVNARSRALLGETAAALTRAEEQFKEAAFELAAAELREALHSLGLITGKYTDPDILNSIFSKFCIGK